MKPSQHEAADQSHRGIKDDDSPSWGQPSSELLQRAARELEMMPHVEQDQIADATAFEAELVGVLDLVDPRIREKVGGDAIQEECLNIAEPGAELDDPAIDISSNPGGDFAV